jgi:nucleotide-binding universal stress UspA family protein
VGAERAPTVEAMAQMALEQAEHSARAAATASAGWRVVVGHDGSASAAAVLEHAARRVGPEGYLVVVHALPLGALAAEAHTGRTYARIVGAVLRSIEAALPDGVSYETRIVSGSPSRALVDSARRCEADEIILGTDGARAVRGAVGRVSDAVLRQAGCPVTIVPPRDGETD